MTHATPARAPFADRLAGDVAAAAGCALVLIGDRLGLYRAMAEAGPIDSVDLARRTGTSERYVREWLAAQAAAGYLDHDAERGTYRLDAERAEVLAGGEPGLLGAVEAVASFWRDEPKLVRAFHSGEGLGWDAHHPSLFRGMERLLGASWRRHLVGSWIPAVPGLVDALARGARVADIGCGSGEATRILARAFPEASFIGVDPHRPSIERARRRAVESGLTARLRYEVATAKDLPGGGYTLVTSLHCLLELGDPASAAARVLKGLAPDGRFLVVEPSTAGRPGEERPPAAGFYSAYSTCVSVPGSRSQEVGACVGSRAGAATIRDVLAAAGFGRIRMLAATEEHLSVLARP